MFREEHVRPPLLELEFNNLPDPHPHRHPLVAGRFKPPGRDNLACGIGDTDVRGADHLDRAHLTLCIDNNDNLQRSLDLKIPGTIGIGY